MKQYIIILAAAICAISACQKNEIELLDQPIIEKLDNGLVSYTFTAVIADGVSDVEGTKATMERNGTFTWVKDDVLRFYRSNGTYESGTITNVDKEGTTATITVTTGDKADFVSAVYPADAGDGAYKVKFNVRGPIVVSAVVGGNLTFRHIGSLINIKFTSIPTGTASLVFKPKTEFDYDGTFSFSSREPVLTPTATKTTQIVVPATTADEGKDITICVPNVALTGGFSAALNNNAAGTGRNLFKKSTATTHNLSTAPPMLLNMKSVACVAPDPKSITITTSSTSGWWDVTDAPLIQTSANTFELSINTDPSTTYNIYDEYNDDALVGTINGSETITLGTNYVGGSIWDNWSPKKGPQMSYVGSTHFAKNVAVTANTFFKITNGTDFGSTNTLGAYGSDYILTPNYVYGSGWNSSYDGAFKIEAAGTYDFYFQGTDVWYQIAKVNDAVSHTTLISYDVSTGVATITDKGIAKASIGRNDRTYDNEVAFVGTFNSWNAANVMTYNGNHIWSSDLEITSAGDYTFKFIHKNDWTIQWRNDNDGNNYPKSAGQMFGTSNKLGEVASGYTFTVALDVANYKVYVNDYTWDSNKFKFAFVKQ